MKIKIDVRVLFVVIFLVGCFESSAQFSIVPIKKNNTANKNTISARTSSALLRPIKLPFWDDFSFNNPHHMAASENFPNDSLWQSGHSVHVSSGFGINPPTYKVATFDGIDSTGLPYNVNSPLAQGLADRLTSRALRMDLVDRTLRDSVYITFYYQREGNGEGPDQRDSLSLWFRNRAGKWRWMWSTNAMTSNTTFIPKKIYIKDTSFFHGNFQFRFQNYARLSGPFDTWNLDYVYVSNGKKQYAPQYGNFPDLAFVAPMTSPFLQYKSIPIKHLLSKPSSLIPPNVMVNNLRSDQNQTANFPQPVKVVSNLTTVARVRKAITKTSKLFDTLSAKPVYYQSPVVFAFDSLLRLSKLDPKTDSAVFDFKLNINPSDNIVKVSPKIGDFDTVVYKGIDFRHNDTLTTRFTAHNYYAYDDGEAEYAATLTQPGSLAAYQFDMSFAQADTLVAVNIYFPHVGDESNQTIQLIIYDTLTTGSKGILTQKNLTVKRTAKDSLVHVVLDTAVLVKKKFFVAWKQNSTATIGIGLDKNSDSGSKIFYNLSGAWLPNTVVKGNLMIRPVFGNATPKIITDVSEAITYAYPNPNRGAFNLPPSVQGLQLVDIIGRSIPFTQENFVDRTHIILKNCSPGIYLVRYFSGKTWRTEKIIMVP